jgi:hypothetical protein
MAAMWPQPGHLAGTNFFRVEAARLLAQHVPVPAHQLYEVLEAPRQADHGDLALPVPRLNKFTKLAGNPADIATKIAADVRRPAPGLYSVRPPDANAHVCVSGSSCVSCASLSRRPQWRRRRRWAGT